MANRQRTDIRSNSHKKSSKKNNKRKNTKKTTPMRLVFVGGLDGIGKNMTAIEYGNDMMLIDAGLMFPDDEHLGVDLILPDYKYVIENQHKLRGIIITHGHEDHTGAIPYLLKDLDNRVPIFAAKLTLALIEGKLKEHNVKNPDLRSVRGGEHLKIGAFKIDFFNVNHSIPDALGLRVKTDGGSILYTGDFKLDLTPVDGVYTDFQAINRFASEGIDVLLSDSTNAGKPGTVPSERDVGASLNDIIQNATGRVFVASFASQIHRIQQVCDAAVSAGRKVAVTGRSMLTNTRIARDLGYLNIASSNLLDAYDIDDYPDDKLLVLCTGSQGEPLSALTRMANGEHRTLAMQSGDTVIISATPVPGNEKSVANLTNSLYKLGVDLWDKNRALVHVSGHAYAEELKLMLAMVKPKYFVPVHGEYSHLYKHARIAEHMGLPKKNIFVLDNGDSLEICNGKARQGDSIESGMIYVDGLRVGDTDSFVLRDRQRLSDDGIVTVVIVLNEQTRKIENIEIVSRGISVGNNTDLTRQAEERVRHTINKNTNKKNVNTNSLKRTVRDSLAGFIWDKLKSKPLILPIVMEV